MAAASVSAPLAPPMPSATASVAPPVPSPSALPKAPCELGPACIAHFGFLQTNCALLLPRGCGSLADETASVMQQLCDDKESSEEACTTYTSALRQLIVEVSDAG